MISFIFLGFALILLVISQIITLGNSVCELATSCVQHGHLSSTHHRDDHATDHSQNCKTQSKLNQSIEMELLTKIQEWLQVCFVTAQKP